MKRPYIHPKCRALKSNLVSWEDYNSHDHACVLVNLLAGVRIRPNLVFLKSIDILRKEFSLIEPSRLIERYKGTDIISAAWIELIVRLQILEINDYNMPAAIEHIEYSIEQEDLSALAEIIDFLAALPVRWRVV